MSRLTRAPLIEVAPPTRSSWRPLPDENVWILNLDQVESGSGKVLSRQQMKAREITSSTVAFDDTHVLYSKLRPNLNKVVLPNTSGYCTSELLPLKPDPQRLDRGYLAHYLRSPVFVAWAVSRTDGAKMPRVKMDVLREYLIPLPELAEQRRIATILDKSDAIRNKRREVLNLADGFLRSVFLDMFGNLFSEKNNEWKKLSDCTDFIDYRGKTPEKSDSGVRLITAKNVRDGVINIEPAEFISEATYSWWMSRGYPRSGDVLFTTEAPLGNVAVLNTQEPVAIGQRLIAIRPREMLRWDYLSWALRQGIVQSDILSRSTGSTVKGIRSAELVQVQIPIPGKVDQLKFEKIVASINHQKSGMQVSAQQGDLLFQSLQHQAFQGYL